jgi:hypothetical protein
LLKSENTRRFFRMKLCVLMLLVTGILVTCAHAASETRHGHRDKSRHDQTLAQINDIIYDLTVPWPFRKPRGIDTDGDGVVDALDRCPGTPPSVRVGRDGCPISETRTEFLDTGNISLNASENPRII